MTEVALPSELWFQVLENLRKPIPEWRSNAPRGDLRQPDLCSAALVSKSFQSMAQQILFTHITTDVITELLPQSPDDIPLRRHLFAHTKSLFLEYTDKNDQPSYSVLLAARGRWNLVGSDPQEWGEGQMEKCGREAESLTGCFAYLNNPQSERVQGLFPLLRSIAVGSIYGGQDRLWRTYAQSFSAKPDAPNPCPSPSPIICSKHFHAFFHSSPLRHLCVRGFMGPLRLLDSTFASIEPPHETPLPSLTAHFTDNADNIPVLYGRMIRWVSDVSPTKQNRDLFQSLILRIQQLSQFAESPAAREARQTSDTVQVDLLCSPLSDDIFDERPELLAKLDKNTLAGRSADGHDPRALGALRVRGIGKTVQDRLRGSSGLQDIFRWGPSEDALRCSACGCLPAE